MPSCFDLLFTVSLHSLINDKAEEACSLYTDSKYACLDKSSNVYHYYQSRRSWLPKHLSNVSLGSLPPKYFTPSRATVSEDFLANSEPPTPVHSKSIIPVTAQRLGRIIKNPRESNRFQFRLVFSGEPFKYITTSCSYFNQRLHKPSHFDTFSKNVCHCVMPFMYNFALASAHSVATQIVSSAILTARSKTKKLNNYIANKNLMLLYSNRIKLFLYHSRKIYLIPILIKNCLSDKKNQWKE